LRWKGYGRKEREKREKKKKDAVGSHYGHYANPTQKRRGKHKKEKRKRKRRKHKHPSPLNFNSPTLSTQSLTHPLTRTNSRGKRKGGEESPNFASAYTPG